jgi:hypothetical protein
MALEPKRENRRRVLVFRREGRLNLSLGLGVTF